MEMQCEFHGHSKLMCPGCRKADKESEKRLVDAGTLVYIACAWRGDGQYKADQANGCKTFKRKAAAQKWCDFLNADGLAMGANPSGYVVRLVFAV